MTVGLFQITREKHRKERGIYIIYKCNYKNDKIILLARLIEMK